MAETIAGMAGVGDKVDIGLCCGDGVGVGGRIRSRVGVEGGNGAEVAPGVHEAKRRVRQARSRHLVSTG